MKYASIVRNDFVNGEGVQVSFFTQGCPHKCEGCFNPSAWDFKGGFEATEQEIVDTIIEAIGANGIQRNFSVLGGEPLCKENCKFVKFLINEVKKVYPSIKVFLWTGYEKNKMTWSQLDTIEKVDVLIDGPFILSQRDITLPLRGSRNQNIYRRIDGHLTKIENNI